MEIIKGAKNQSTIRFLEIDKNYFTENFFSNILTRLKTKIDEQKTVQKCAMQEAIPAECNDKKTKLIHLKRFLLR